MEITLEKIDAVVERTYVSYKEAKEALEINNGDVLDAIIYLESKDKDDYEDKSQSKNQSLEEFKDWLKDLINKGNVTRIKIKKDDEVLANIPVNAGIAATIIAVTVPAIFAFGVIAAIATKITIEITMEDGTVKVVNKYVYDAAKDIKDKAYSFKDEIKGKFNKNVAQEKNNANTEDNIYSYKVEFNDKDKDDKDEV